MVFVCSGQFIPCTTLVSPVQPVLPYFKQLSPDNWWITVEPSVPHAAPPPEILSHRWTSRRAHFWNWVSVVSWLLWLLSFFSGPTSSDWSIKIYLDLETGRGSAFWFGFCFCFFVFFLPYLLWMPSALPLFQIYISDFPIRIGIFVLSSKNFNSRKDTLIQYLSVVVPSSNLFTWCPFLLTSLFLLMAQTLAQTSSLKNVLTADFFLPLSSHLAGQFDSISVAFLSFPLLIRSFHFSFPRPLTVL